MIEYIIKKKNKKHYLVGIERNNNRFISIYSDDIEEAFHYTNYSDASTIVIFLNGIGEEELEIIEIKPENDLA